MSNHTTDNDRDEDLYEDEGFFDHDIETADEVLAEMRDAVRHPEGW